MLNATELYFPGVNCVHCGRFIGRDGHFAVEWFEMSDVIASVDGECAACLDRPHNASRPDSAGVER